MSSDNPIHGTPSAADLHAVVRRMVARVRQDVEAQERGVPDLTPVLAAEAALDALLARCQEAERLLDAQSSIDRAYGWKQRAEVAERERDEARKRADWLYRDAEAKHAEIKALEAERDEAQDALQSLAADHYFARAEVQSGGSGEDDDWKPVYEHVPPHPMCCAECKQALARVAELEQALRLARRELSAWQRYAHVHQMGAAKTNADLISHIDAALQSGGGECDGSADCPATVHIHGCFSERRVQS